MEELELYLSDSIAPLLAADSLNLLAQCPPSLVAMQCESWARQQFQAHAASVRMSSLLFHAFKKINVLSELGLIAPEVLTSFLEDLKGLLLEACPEAERPTLQGNLVHAGAGGAPVTRKVDLLFHGRESGSSTTPPDVASHAPVSSPLVEVAPAVVSNQQQQQQFAMLLDRLSQLPALGAEPSASGTDSTSTTDTLHRQLIATAVESASSEHDLQQLLNQVSERSKVQVDVETAIRELSRDLPDWGLRGEDESATYQGPIAAAIDKIVHLTDDAEKGAGRFWELISGAVEQFNRGALSRAVTLIGLAEKLGSRPDLDTRRIRAARRSGAAAIDVELLKKLSLRPETHDDLRIILSSFGEWSPDGLLDRLDEETNRGQRRLLLNLLELHREPAREAALKRLEGCGRSNDSQAWAWQRNLVHLLRRIAVVEREPLEFELLAATSELDRAPQLVRESVAALGSTRSDEATVVLAERLRSLLEGGEFGHWVGEEAAKLRNEIALALAQIGTENARGWLVALALEARGGLLPLDLLEPLADTDLSPDEKMVKTLLDTLESLLPVKVLGLALPASVATLRNRQGALHIIRALAGTRSEEVARRLESLRDRFKETELGSTAARTAAAIRSAMTQPSRAAVPAPQVSLGSLRVDSSGPHPVGDELLSSSAVFEGDLAVFGLPDVLQSLGQLGIDGHLHLTDADGEEVATIGIRNSRVVEAAIGDLTGPEAIYEILEAPFPGSFAFLRSSEWKRDDPGHDVIGLTMEGMRRFDEYKRMVALVPDDSLLTPTGQKPTPLSDEDALILRPVWLGVKRGSTPAEIEQTTLVDRFRVRSLLAHWVQEGALSIG